MKGTPTAVEDPDSYRGRWSREKVVIHGLATFCISEAIASRLQSFATADGDPSDRRRGYANKQKITGCLCKSGKVFFHSLIFFVAIISFLAVILAAMQS